MQGLLVHRALSGPCHTQNRAEMISLEFLFTLAHLPDDKWS